jgi:hypothetical protein
MCRKFSYRQLVLLKNRGKKPQNNGHKYKNKVNSAITKIRKFTQKS